jgi:DNA polymerase I
MGTKRYAGHDFRQIVTGDFEFKQNRGERPTVHLGVFHELVSGREIQLRGSALTHDNMGFLYEPGTLFCAHSTTAELSCLLALGLPLPELVLDTFIETRCLTNGRPGIGSAGLLDTCLYFGIPAMSSITKKANQQLAIRGNFSPEEWDRLGAYCNEDVNAVDAVLGKLEPYINLREALLRGRFMRAISKVEHQGIPLDVSALGVLRSAWDFIQDKLIRDVDPDHEIFDKNSFRQERWLEWVNREGIAWPLLPSGRPDLEHETFRDMAAVYPQVRPIHELRSSLAKMRLHDLAVGQDGRNRCYLAPFRTATGRNAPSTSEFVWGSAAWLRGLVQPQPGYGLAYIDWSAQELAISAWLSGDLGLQNSYLTNDPYIDFAKLARAVPE